jgi:hypothetical protein
MLDNANQERASSRTDGERSSRRQRDGCVDERTQEDDEDTGGELVNRKARIAHREKRGSHGGFALSGADCVLQS